MEVVYISENCKNIQCTTCSAHCKSYGCECGNANLGD